MPEQDHESPQPPQPVSLLIGELCDELAADPAFGGEIQRELYDIADQCRQPLRIAVTGDVSTGKSTLVNALLGMERAAVGWRETTARVTWYMHPTLAAPRGLADGHVYEPAEFPLASKVILIDTPGVNTPSENEQLTEEMIAGGSRAAGSAVVLLYLCGRTVSSGTEEPGMRERIRSFASLTGGAISRGLNIVLIGAKADMINAPAADIEDNLLREAGLECSRAAAVCQQAAASARTGRLSEAHLATLRVIADDPPLTQAAANGWPSLRNAWVGKRGFDGRQIDKFTDTAADRGAVAGTTFALVKSLPAIRDGTVSTVEDLATLWEGLSGLAALESIIMCLADDADMLTVFAVEGRLRRLRPRLGRQRAAIVGDRLDRVREDLRFGCLPRREAALALGTSAFAEIALAERMEAIDVLHRPDHQAYPEIARRWQARALCAGQSTLIRTVAGVIIDAALDDGGA